VTVDLPTAAADPIRIRPARQSRNGGRSRRARVATLAGALAVLSAAWIAMLFLLRAQGVIIIGDEPHYLVEAISIGRFHTLNMNPDYVFAVEHHSVYPWTAKPGPHLAATIGQAIYRHNLYLPFHAIGLSVLLAVPMFFGATVAVVTLIIMLALLTVALVYLTGEVSQVESPARNLIALLFLAPAFILATDQVFPDLISGLVLAIVVMTMARTEIRRRCHKVQLISVAFCLVLLPWLDQKNIFFPIPLVVAFLVVWRRAQMPRPSPSIVVVPTLMSLAGLLCLNLYEFGDLLGGPQRIELISMNTLTRALALLVDRRQGLFVQLPIALLGIAGLWNMRKKVPIAVITAAFVIAVTIYGNASQPDSFGGYSFVGRFQWPVLPVLLAFAGLYIIRLWQVRNPLVIGVVGISLVLFFLQFLLILRREHEFYNINSWDPLAYAGWWGGLDPSPILGYIGRDAYLNARVDWGIVCVVASCCLVLYVLVQVAKQSPHFRPWAIGWLGALVLLSYPMTLSAAPLRPEFSPAASYVAVVQSRICDTRAGNPSDLHGVATQCSDGLHGETLQPGVPLSFVVAGQFGVPSKGVTAVALNVTATNLASPGSFTVFPAGQSPPLTPTFFTYDNAPTSSLVQVGVGPAGMVSISSSVAADAVVDVEGYLTSHIEPGAGLYHALREPARLCATSTIASYGTQGTHGTHGAQGTHGTHGEQGTHGTHGTHGTQGTQGDLCQGGRATYGSPATLRSGALEPVAPLTISVLGRDAIPTSAVTALFLRVTAIDPQSSGYLSVASVDLQRSPIPVVSFTTGQSATGSVIIPPAPDGTVTVSSSAVTDVAVDAIGYFSSSSIGAGSARFTPEIAPVRICDTRGSNPSGLTGSYAQCNPSNSSVSSDRPIRPGETRTIQVSGLGYVPPVARAVELIVTPVPPASTTSLAIEVASVRTSATSFPPDGGYADGVVVASLSKDGRVTIVNVSRSNVNFVVDLIGWYSP
jgi:hypothetical protein